MQLEIAPNLDYYTLRYYYSLETHQEQLNEVLLNIKKQLKDCVTIANKLEILKQIKTTGLLSNKLHLQSAKDYVDDKRDSIAEDITLTLKRKTSENPSSQGFSDFVGGYMRDRANDRKSVIPDIYMLDIVSKKDFEFPELITGTDSYKTSIFAAVRSEIVQNSPKTVHYLPKLSSIDDFYFLFNAKSLVKISCSVIEKEPMKLIDPKASFNEGQTITLASSIVNDNPKRNMIPSTSTERKEKIVTKMITICFYATEDIPGDFGYVNTLVNSLIEKNVLENFRRFIRRMGVMRADSTLAKYFLSEEPKEFKFECPKVNDKTNFLFMLKNNLHMLMSRVTGTVDNLITRDNNGRKHSRTYGEDDGTYEFRQRGGSHSMQDSPILGTQPIFKPALNYRMTPNCTDQVFFFNYSDLNARLFGPVLFFLNIADQNYDFKYYNEFMANDGQYTTLVKHNDESYLDFDSLVLKDGSLKSRLSVVNGIKNIKHTKDSTSAKGIDKLVFHISSRYDLFYLRGSMKEAGLVELLETAIKNSVIELAIEQWLHSLYLMPDLEWRSETKEYQIVDHMKVFINLKIAPPSITQKVISHKIQSIDYFKHFTASVMKGNNKEFSNFFKNKDSVESVFYFQNSENRIEEFESMEQLDQYIKNSYTFDQFGRSFSRSASNENSFNEEDIQEKPLHSLGPATPIQTLDDLLKDRNQSNYDTQLQREDTIYTNNSNLKLPIKSPFRNGPKKFNHYAFDVTKGTTIKRDSFFLVMRLKSAPITDSTPLDQYSKVNAHQSEPKTIYNENGDEKKMQFPVRRFLVCLEVSTNDVRLLTYNVKEDIIAKLYESLAEEISYQEMRETLVLGLTSKQIMRSISKSSDASDFETRLCERYEKTRVESHRKLNEHQIGLKLTWDYRFGDKDKSKTMNKQDNSTITEQVYEMIKGESNSLLPAEHRISFGHRNQIKQLMDSIYSIIKVTHTKIDHEALEVRFMPEPSLLDGCWLGDQASVVVSDGRVSKNYTESQIDGKPNTRGSLYLGIPSRKIEDIGSNRSISAKSKKIRPTSSITSPLSRNDKKNIATMINIDWNIDVPAIQMMQKELNSPTEISETKKLKKSRSNQFCKAKSEYDLRQDDDVLIDEKPMPNLEVSFDLYIDRSILNLNMLQRNFTQHIFDMRVKQIFSSDEAFRIEKFSAIKQNRKICLIKSSYS